MKRFYCTICKKIKRVRKYPSNTVTPCASNPAERVGSCNRHSSHPIQLVHRVNEITRSKTNLQSYRTC